MQSRAYHTSLAIQDAFVRLLTESPYESVTIRAIVDLAGTGLGSFYEYFANKEDLARVCVHLRSKRLLKALTTPTHEDVPVPLAREPVLDTALDRLLAVHADAPLAWGAHYVLERRFTGLAEYAAMYERFVRAWEHVLRGSDASVGPPRAARTCLTIAYGLLAHAHMRYLASAVPRAPMDHGALRDELRAALSGYLARVMR